MNNHFKIFLAVALSFITSFNLSALPPSTVGNETFSSVENKSNRFCDLANANDADFKVDNTFKLANETADLISSLKTTLVPSKLSETKWANFVSDFGDDAFALSKFSDNPSLIDAWKELFTLNAHPSLRKNPDFLEDFIGVIPKHVPSGPMVGKKIGHTFTKHGSHNTRTLTYQAVNGTTPIGQWLDDIAAEDFIARHLSQLGQGARDIPIPNSVGGIGRVFKLGAGEIVEVTHIRLVPSGSGVDTAFPINSGFTSLNPLGTYVP